MRFSEFAQMLFPVIGAGSSTSAFTRTLFDSIVEDNGQGVVESLKDSTFKAYYNGNNDISKISRTITAYLEPMEFEEYINNFPDSTVQLLCDSFEPYISEINLHNASTKITELFTSIIKESASTNKKNTPKSANKTNNIISDTLNEKILASGKAFANGWANAVNNLSDNLTSDKTEHIEAEVVDDEEPSGAAENESQESTNIQIINNPTIVNQYGEKNIHIEYVDKLSF